MEDIEVVRRIKNGDIEAFSILVGKYHNHLLNFIYRLTGDVDIVEDIGQEVFLSVYKSLKNFDDNRGTPFSAWLFITARNRCISEMRKKGNRKFVPLDDITLGDKRTGLDLLIDNEQRQALKTSLDQLPEHYRTIILRSLDGDSISEIAGAENISPGTVKSRLFRAKERIRGLIKEFLGGEDYERI